MGGALPPGTRFGELEIQGVLGIGGFGVVYLAYDSALDRQVALKEFMPASLAVRAEGARVVPRTASDAETYAIGMRSFVNEARLLARFDHACLLKVHRFWEDNGTAYMVMPYLQGTTLKDLRRGMTRPPEDAWLRHILACVLDALELLHAEGVYHRDIAPDNILILRDGSPVLLDFGAARRVIGTATQALTAILKPSYAPIEQYAEMSALRQGPWTDLYALGAVMHFLIMGRPPSPSTARAVQPVGGLADLSSVPGVSPLMLDMVAWMLAVRPLDRPQNAAAVRAVLRGESEPSRRWADELVPTGDEAETRLVDAPLSIAPETWNDTVKDAASEAAGKTAVAPRPPASTPAPAAEATRMAPRAPPREPAPVPRPAPWSTPTEAFDRPAPRPVHRRGLVVGLGLLAVVAGLGVAGVMLRGPAAGPTASAPVPASAPSTLTPSTATGYDGPTIGQAASVPVWDTGASAPKR
jgi:serine/threonine protein kinase